MYIPCIFILCYHHSEITFLQIKWIQCSLFLSQSDYFLLSLISISPYNQFNFYYLTEFYKLYFQELSLVSLHHYQNQNCGSLIFQTNITFVLLMRLFVFLMTVFVSLYIKWCSISKMTDWSINWEVAEGKA